ncbi:MAG: PAS domain-containing protein [Steroidobacteraceae bacterium]
MAVAAQVAEPQPIERDLEVVRLALESSGLGVFEYRPAHGALRVSAWIVALLGPPAAADQLPLAELACRLHPADLARLQKVWPLAAETAKPVETEFRLRTADGTYRWLRARASAAGEGASRRWCGTCEDIDERRRALDAHREQEARFRLALEEHAETEAQLRESEAQLRLALEAANMHTWHADLEHDRFEPSPGSRILHGLPPGDTPLTAEDLLARLHPDDEARIRQRLAERRLDGARVEYRTVAADGSVRWLEVTARALGDGGGGRTSRVIGTAWDITERKAAESALTALYETSPLLIGVVELVANGDLRHVYDNPAVCRFFGVDAGVTAGRRASELGVDAATIALWRGHYDAAVAADAPVSFEYRHLQQGSKERILSVTVAPLRQYGPSGRPIACYVAEDVTQRRQASLAVANSEARLKLATDAARLAIHDQELATGRVRWDARMRELWGLTADEPVAADSFIAGVHPDDAAAAARAMQAALDPDGAGRFTLEFRAAHGAAGEERWIQATGQVAFDERRPVRLVGTAQDVTERKRLIAQLQAAQETSRSNEERLRLALHAAKAGAWEWDLREGAVRWSAEMFELYGFTRSPGTLRFEDFELGVDPRDRATVREAIDAAMRDESSVFATDFRVRQPHGQLRWLRALGNVERSPAGTPLRMYGLNLDVTAQKQMEEALQQADRQKDQFLAMLSHELRNPLAPIRTVAKILSSPHVDGEQIAWSRQVIQRQVHHLALLLDDLLDVARITQGKLVLKPEVVPAQAIIEPAIEAVQPMLEEKQHRLSVQAPPPGTRLRVDALRIAQVLSNLLTNAARYTPAGGRIELRVEPLGDALVIEVSDNGVGIPPQALPHIFAMFSQVDSGGAPAGGGLGIGLALAKGLVDLHGGSIEAHSGGPGTGSTFRVVLPGALGDAAAPRAEGAAAVPTAATRRVLVVDDNQDAADALGMLLRLAGHDVRVAHGGIDGLQAAAAFRPEICIVDIGMPDMDGYAVARALRSEPWAQALRLVAPTGWGQATDKARAITAGFDTHLTKPVDPDHVEALIAGLDTRSAAVSAPTRPS